MVLLTWLRTNKYKVATALLICLVLYGIHRDMVKDFTYEKAMMKIEFRDEKNKALQDQRAQLNVQSDAVNDKIRAGEIEDSVVKVNTYFLDQRIKDLLLLKNNNYEKNKAIDNLGSDELRDYFRKLPKYNDYQR